MGYVEELREGMQGLSRKQFDTLKVKLARKHKLSGVPANHELVLNGLRIVNKPMRISSGVAVIAMMSMPYNCPHGKCIFCPGGINSPFGDVPQSYTGNEPSTLRGMRNDYDSYLIAFNRLEQYFVTGHLPEKIEFIVQGGTFLAYPQEYQDEFITYSYKALNDFGELFYRDGLDVSSFKEFFELPGNFKDRARVERIMQKERDLKGDSSLEQEKQRNERARIRAVALCIETKPDWCFEEHIDAMLRFGTTRVELGVQCLRDEVLKFTHRGHDLADVQKATRLMRNSLLKVGYHMMPGLPGMSREDDIADMETLFSDGVYMPDALKVYPCLVFEGTGLYHLFEQGKFSPIDADTAADVIIASKKHVPKWCRIMRVQRDIPEKHVFAGAKMTNLRQVVHEKMSEQGVVCECIRCREPRNKRVDWDSVKLQRMNYTASGGKEVFLSFEDVTNNLLLGFLRLRHIPESHRHEISSGDAGVRELHVYGVQTPLGEDGSIQHRGLGKKLMAEAEMIARDEWGSKKMLVISGVGVREYYYNLGYTQDGVYVSKEL